MPKAKVSSKSAKTAPAAPTRIPEGISVRDLFKLARQMGMSAEQFERLSGASTSKLRRGRGGDEIVPAEKLTDFRQCETIFQRAVALCGGNESLAAQWVSSDAPALKGKKPIEAAESQTGFKAVEKLLSQLEGAVG